MKRLAFALCGLLMFVIGSAYAFHWIPPASTKKASCPADVVGVSIGGPFELVNQDGVSVTDQAFADHYLLIYFGYISCPDICQPTLDVMSRAIDLLGDKADLVQPLFISVDPERDDVAAMKDYISHFHESFQGLTGSPEQVAAAAAAYRVFYQKAPTTPDDPFYFVNHTSRIYLMDRQRRYVTGFSHLDSAEKIAETLKLCVQP